MAEDEMDRFEQLYRSAHKLTAEADKRDVAKADHILALNLAQFGDAALAFTGLWW